MTNASLPVPYDFLTVESSSSEPDWDDLVQAGKVAVAKKGEAKFHLGELASLVSAQRKYGESTLKRYAEAIGEDYSRLLDYMRVWQAFEISACGENLTWSHYRELVGVTDSAEWETKASEGGWSVDKLRKELRRAGWRSRESGPVVVVGDFPDAPYTIEFKPTADTAKAALAGLSTAYEAYMQAWGLADQLFFVEQLFVLRNMVGGLSSIIATLEVEERSRHEENRIADERRRQEIRDGVRPMPMPLFPICGHEPRCAHHSVWDKETEGNYSICHQVYLIEVERERAYYFGDQTDQE